MSSLPRNQVGSGGIEKLASSRQHRDDRRDVGAVPGVDEAGDELAGALVAQRPQRLLLGTGRALALELRAGPLQGAVHRGDRGLEDLGGLPGAEAEHVAQEQRRALVGRQELEGGDVGELDRPPGPRSAGARPDRARSRPTRPAARRAARADRPRCRRRPAARAACAPRGRAARRWWRSCRARSGASCAPRTRTAPSTPPAARPGARRRRRGPSPASGSSARGARGGAARRARRRRPRRRPGSPPSCREPRRCRS